jgi:hypothetical protein
MFALMALVAVFVLASPVRAADAAASGGFTIEGVADPSQIKERSGTPDPADLEDRVRKETYSDALFHLSSYTRGVPFDLNFTATPTALTRPFATPKIQVLGAVLPKDRQYQVLGTGLMLGRMTFAKADVAKLKLAEGLGDLPVYTAQGRFPNDLYPGFQPRVSGTIHWMAAADCYRSAVMQHLAKTYGNRPVVSVSGRAFPVRVVKATWERLPDKPTETPKAPETPKTDAPPTPGTEPAKTPEATKAPEPAAKDAPLTSEETKPAAAPQPPSTQQKLEAYFYHLEMDVRVEITKVAFGDEPATTPNTESKPATNTPTTTPDSPTPPTPAPAPTPAPDTNAGTGNPKAP